MWPVNDADEAVSTPVFDPVVMNFHKLFLSYSASEQKKPCRWLHWGGVHWTALVMEPET